MLTFVSIGYLFLQIYLDCNESLRNLDWDDVVVFPLAQLPLIVSPMKQRNRYNEEARKFDKQAAPEELVPLLVVPPEHIPRRTSNRVQAMEEANNPNLETDDEDDSNYNESVIVDRDNDISDGDDDLIDDEINEDQAVNEIHDVKVKKQCCTGKENEEVFNEIS